MIVIPSVFGLLLLFSPLRRVSSVGYRAVGRLAIEVDRISLKSNIKDRSGKWKEIIVEGEKSKKKKKNRHNF
ncbi:hypothetical protein BDV28DRAFT_133741, partial [Aspergillus coremiiformis]